MSGYNYWTSYDMTVTREEARIEIEKHETDGGFEQFVAEYGDLDEYEGQDVLGFIGV